jgi:hypothetical protein
MLLLIMLSKRLVDGRWCAAQYPEIQPGSHSWGDMTVGANNLLGKSRSQVMQASLITLTPSTYSSAPARILAPAMNPGGVRHQRVLATNNVLHICSSSMGSTVNDKVDQNWLSNSRLQLALQLMLQAIVDAI